MRPSPRASSATVLLLVLLAAPVRGQQPNPYDVSGAWVGIYHSYPYIVEMQVHIDRPGPAATATVALAPVEDIRSNSRRPVGSFEASVRYDDATRSFEMYPSADALNALGFQVFPYRGVLDRDAERIGGSLDGASGNSSPFFVLSRPGDAYEREIREPAVEAMRNSERRPGRRGRKVDPEEIVAWAARFLEEYPEVDVARIRHGPFELQARNLYEDEHFTRHFGETYDQLDLRDFEALRSDLSKLPGPDDQGPTAEAAGVARAMTGLRSVSGTYGAPDITVSVLAMRHIRAWRDQVVRDITADGPGRPGRGRLRRLEEAGSQALAMLWPSERRDFEEALRRAEGPVAAPPIPPEFQTLLVTASGWQGAREIRAALNIMAMQSGAAWSPAQETTRAQFMEALEGRLHQLLSQEMGADLARLRTVGEGLDGLAAAVDLQRLVGSKYGEFREPGTTLPLADSVRARRQALLAAHREDLLAEIRAVDSSEEASALMTTYLLPMPGDAPLSAELHEAAEARRSFLLAAEARAADAEAAAARRAASPCHQATDQPRGVWDGEPSAQDVCWAVDRRLESMSGGLDALSDSCESAASGALSALLCAIGAVGDRFGIGDIRLASFHFESCVPLPDGPAGFECYYRTRLDADAPLPQAVLALDTNEAVATRFVQTPDGWVASFRR